MFFGPPFLWVTAERDADVEVALCLGFFWMYRERSGAITMLVGPLRWTWPRTGASAGVSAGDLRERLCAKGRQDETAPSC